MNEDKPTLNDAFVKQSVAETAERISATPFVSLYLSKKHSGRSVSVSVVAEAARRGHCLCIHKDENGRDIICERLRGNLADENICPFALINYVLRVCGGIANAVSACPYYIAPKNEPTGATESSKSDFDARCEEGGDRSPSDDD